MDDEDEFETYFRRAVERGAPVKQLSQQYIPSPKTPTTRRASLQAPDAMYSSHMAASSKRRSLSPSSDVGRQTRTNATSVSPKSHSARRRCRKSQSYDTEQQHQLESSSSSSTTSSWLARHFDSSYSPGSRSRRHRRSQLKSIVSSPGDVVHRSVSRSPPVGPSTAVRHGRRATLAGDLLQISPATYSRSRRRSAASRR